MAMLLSCLLPEILYDDVGHAHLLHKYDGGCGASNVLTAVDMPDGCPTNQACAGETWRRR
jgi:hypothetical protein